MKKTAIILFFLFIATFVHRSLDYKVLRNSSNVHLARNLYELVNKTRPSEVSSEENSAIIERRLECYGAHADYTTRIRNCNNAYVKDIVEQARAAIASRPDMGKFVSNINMCPVMHNMCIGKTQNDMKRCVLFERQCVDYMLDTYWRGAAQYAQQQYRNE